MLRTRSRCERAWTRLGLPNPAWAEARSEADVAQFLAEHGGEAILKTARGGYDGKGVMVLRDVADARPWLDAAAAGGPRLLLEQKVPFVREPRGADRTAALW
ncbi:hypothetical protein GCM10025876_26900 [Demequina litorisediminis]|uniref:ATP-grasp domain-containing protein n=1 Tax=Demequina litorisediminis TaxID=1849022 RepID=A0ABQ6IGD0_9MICO|nr:hypothetical protein GCM10025876_26900 [Demequina litorisediminis]